jgi:hypothetical protein
MCDTAHSALCRRNQRSTAAPAKETANERYEIGTTVWHRKNCGDSSIEESE